MKEKLIWIALDGPAGSGKSTIASKLLNYLNNFIYVNTGAMYRSLAYFLLQKNVNPNLESSVKDALDDFHVRLEHNQVYLIIDNKKIDITSEIYNEKIAKLASDVSQFSCVRDKLIAEQRLIANNNNVVMDGRDIGTVVLPDATLKIYLDASIRKRAERRYKQINCLDSDETIETISYEIMKRDQADKNRELGALKQADDAILITTDNLTVDECCQKIIHLLDEKLKQVN